MPSSIGTADALTIRSASPSNHFTAWARFVTKADGGGILAASAARLDPTSAQRPIVRYANRVILTGLGTDEHKYDDVRCVAFGLGLGARREHLPDGAATDEQRRPRPKATQPSGRQSFLPQASLLAPHRPVKGMLVARASPAPKMPCRERHRIYAHQYLGRRLRDFPKVGITPEINRSPGDGRRAQNRFSQVQFTDDFPFGLGGVHHLRDACLADAIEKMSHRHRRGAKRAFQAKLPLAFPRYCGTASQNTAVTQREDLFPQYDRAGRAGTKAAGLPKLFRLLVAAAKLERGQAAAGGTYRTPAPVVAEGIDEPPPADSHTIFPLTGSMAVRPAEDRRTTISCFPLPTKTGEVQFALWGRSIFHRFAPVAKSRPAMNASLSLSTCVTTTPPAINSDDDMPTLSLAFG